MWLTYYLTDHTPRKFPHTQATYRSICRRPQKEDKRIISTFSWIWIEGYAIWVCRICLGHKALSGGGLKGSAWKGGHGSVQSEAKWGTKPCSLQISHALQGRAWFENHVQPLWALIHPIIFGPWSFLRSMGPHPSYSPVKPTGLFFLQSPSGAQGSISCPWFWKLPYELLSMFRIVGP